MDDLLHTPLFTCLACAALDPGLRSILVFDAPYTRLREIEELLAQMLTCLTGPGIVRRTLAASARDDDLWGYTSLPDNENGAEMISVPHLFSRQQNENNLLLITIPNLAALDLVTARSTLVSMGADVLYLERSGHHECWQPHQYWLAGCSSSEQHIGAISPHLLDRFALRLSWKQIEAQSSWTWQTRTDELLTEVRAVSLRQRITLSPDSRERIIK